MDRFCGQPSICLILSVFCALVSFHRVLLDASKLVSTSFLLSRSPTLSSPSHPLSLPSEVVQAVATVPSSPLQNLRCSGAYAARAVSSTSLFLSLFHRVLFCLRARIIFVFKKKRKHKPLRCIKSSWFTIIVGSAQLQMI